MPVALKVGDVIRIFDSTTEPAKPKRFLCVFVAEGWFLRINTKPIWKPHFPLPHAGNEHCLDHDSFLELRGIVEYDEYLIEEALEEPDNLFGQLNKVTIELLIAHLPKIGTLTKEERDTIIANLAALL